MLESTQGKPSKITGHALNREEYSVRRKEITMKLKEKITIWGLVIVSLMAGFFFYKMWTSEFLWGLFFVILFVAVPILIVVTLRLWTRCPRCRKYGAIQSTGAELQRKGIDSDLPPDHPVWKHEETSLDLSIDLYDIICRYRCKYCNFEWEEKPPPSYKLDSPPPPHEKGEKD